LKEKIGKSCYDGETLNNGTQQATRENNEGPVLQGGMTLS